ncbi:hypothetical protein Syun_031321 [Stephania yunnanensis]|uniref:Uncharacterized protein n=1 Tax=Stephania yunnanensis TaxID=152371 RepID=A0AAP0DZ53_9MAGN
MDVADRLGHVDLAMKSSLCYASAALHSSVETLNMNIIINEHSGETGRVSRDVNGTSEYVFEEIIVESGVRFSRREWDFGVTQKVSKKRDGHVSYDLKNSLEEQLLLQPWLLSGSLVLIITEVVLPYLMYHVELCSPLTTSST